MQLQEKTNSNVGIIWQVCSNSFWNIPIIRSVSILNGLKQIPGPFIHEIGVSKGSGSVLNGYESMVGK